MPHQERKHAMEDQVSWETYLRGIGEEEEEEARKHEEDNDNNDSSSVDESDNLFRARRRLKHHHHHKHEQQQQQHLLSAEEVEAQKEAEWRVSYEEKLRDEVAARRKKRVKHKQYLKELWADPGIRENSVHGIMIDAGSTGSRLHIYEWQPRVLRDEVDIQAAVSGEKLSFPGYNSRWTERLRPGLATFGDLPDDDNRLDDAVADYLEPLIDFAKTILHSKSEEWGTYRIFLRATAGMRILNPTDRARVIGSVRSLFSNDTYCPFYFVDEQARVLSGEEEAIYDWTGVNFLMGDLIEESAGAGTVINPRMTHGALDLGGASTQISFYEPGEDIMSNLFKLQIGQAKHWNLYAHSFLFYGMNEAIDRFHARLAGGKNATERMVTGIYNPCLPGGGTKTEIRTAIHVDRAGLETWQYNQTYPSGNGFYQAILKNDNERGNADECLALAGNLLHREKNGWCEFAHGDCSFAGVYQPKLPTDSETFGEFLAFSNYYHVWHSLRLEERSTIAQLEDASRRVCDMSYDELVAFNGGRKTKFDLNSLCFESAYIFQMLRNGYGFQASDTIRAVEVIKGHKVGWALGAMLYEINTLPWQYDVQQVEPSSTAGHHHHHPGLVVLAWDTLFVIGIAVVVVVLLLTVYVLRERNLRRMYQYQYQPVKDVAMDVRM